MPHFTNLDFSSLIDLEIYFNIFFKKYAFFRDYTISFNKIDFYKTTISIKDFLKVIKNPSAYCSPNSITRINIEGTNFSFFGLRGKTSPVTLFSAKGVILAVKPYTCEDNVFICDEIYYRYKLSKRIFHPLSEICTKYPQYT